MKHILKPGRNCWNIRETEETGLLIDGRDYYLAFYEASKKARRYILISGWQFDSYVRLLRGSDAESPYEDTRFLPFLNSLCENNPDLEIYILAWDFHIIFMMEREWMQDWIFNWSANSRIHFLFDNNHAIGASQHQKFVVIDGHVAFIGGMDICDNRWDDSRHKAYNPYRTDSDNKQYGPYHDIQTYHTGRLALQLADLFKGRWQHLTNSILELPEAPDHYDPGIAQGLSISTDRVALSRTYGKTFGNTQGSIVEIRNLYLDAIRAAEELIYIENQYFSSYAVYTALVERMQALNRPKLQIVIILPKRPQAILEEISVGITQSRILRSLRDLASRTGHSLGIYYTAATAEDGMEKPVYIHSKLLLVDDRFLSVGSANTTNRSLGIDIELNISWEVASLLQHQLVRSIRQARITLLDEHSGVSRCRDCSSLGRIKGLVDQLNSLADQPGYRLRRHGMDTFFDDSEWLKALEPGALPFDPERPYIEEDLYEIFSPNGSSLFSEGITLLRKWLNKPTGPADPGKPPQ